MVTTKYIVDNLNNQTINGGIEINGDFTVSGVSTTTLSTYRALLSQTGSILATSIGTLNDQFLIGETYTITNYVSPDDFSNIANVQSGVINETGCVFIATGTTPTYWLEGSEITSNGGLVVTEIENNLGYDLNWSWAPFGGQGYYVAFNGLEYGPIPNSFPKLKTQVFTQITYPYDLTPNHIILAGVGNFMASNNIIIVETFDLGAGMSTDNLLYYTPIRIDIQQDMVRLAVSGTVDSSYPIDNVSVGLYCDGNFIDNYYGNTDNANNITELVSILNSDPDTNILGTYSDPGDGGVLLSITTHNAKIFCPTGTLTFEVFAD